MMHECDTWRGRTSDAAARLKNKLFCRAVPSAHRQVPCGCPTSPLLHRKKKNKKQMSLFNYPSLFLNKYTRENRTPHLRKFKVASPKEKKKKGGAEIKIQ